MLDKGPMSPKGIAKSLLSLFSILALVMVLAVPAFADADTSQQGVDESSVDVILEMLIEAQGGAVVDSVDNCPAGGDPERGCGVDPNG
ncbi:MAG: hypothetical protein AAGD01_16530 [Acidobacteriota bacterium]